MENCKNIIQSSSLNHSSSPYCDKCINKLETTKREAEKMSAKRDIAKSSGIEIPVTYETSRSSSRVHNDISAYDSASMSSNSKLYNVKSLGRPGNNRSESLYEPRKYDELPDFSNRYRPSVPLNSSYFNSPTFSGTKEKCKYCSKLLLASSTSRSKDVCSDCGLKFGSRLY